MSSYNPPSEQLSEFNNNVFSSTTGTTLTFPVAQGLESFPSGLLSNSIQPSSSSSAVSLYTTGTGNITIGGVNTLTTINSSTSNNGNVYITNGLNQAGNLVISCGNGNIGDVNMLTAASQTGSLNLLTGASNTGNFTIGRPITTSYVPSAITVNTQIGYQYTISGTSLSSLGTTLQKNGTLLTLPAGVWIVNATAVLGASSASTNTVLSFSTSASVADTTRNQTFYPPSGLAGLSYNMNTTYSLTASSTIYMYGNVSINTQGTTSISGYATRIA